MQDSKKTSLKELGTNLWVIRDAALKKWRKILLGLIASACLGAALSFILPATYTAELVFVLETNQSKGDLSSIASKFGFSLGSNTGGLFQEDDNMIAFMKSRTMITEALFTTVTIDNREQLLIDRFVQFNDYRKKWKKSIKHIVFHNDPLKRTRLEDSLIGEFCKEIAEKNLQIFKPDRKGDIIVATTTIADEIFAKAFTESLLEKVTASYIKTVTKRAQENVNILQHQVDSVKKLLNSALVGVATSTDANLNINPAYQRLTVPVQKNLVNVEMNKAILEELVKHFELAKITLRHETPLISIIDKPILPLEKKELTPIVGIIVGSFLFLFSYFVYLTLNLYFRGEISGNTEDKD